MFSATTPYSCKLCDWAIFIRMETIVQILHLNSKAGGRHHYLLHFNNILCMMSLILLQQVMNIEGLVDCRMIWVCQLNGGETWATTEGKLHGCMWSHGCAR
jgi:hypothetical protein